MVHLCNTCVVIKCSQIEDGGVKLTSIDSESVPDFFCFNKNNKIQFSEPRIRFVVQIEFYEFGFDLPHVEKETLDSGSFTKGPLDFQDLAPGGECFTPLSSNLENTYLS